MSKLIIPTYQTRFARYAAESKAPDLWRGLRGAWLPFLGPTGLTLFDWSEYQNHGALTDMDVGTDWIVDQSYALNFDGTDNRVIIPDADALSFTKTHTICVWLKPSNNANYGTVLIKGTNTGLGQYEYVVDMGLGGNALRYFISANAGISNILTTTVSDDLHFIAGVADGSNLWLYLDGEQKDTDTQNRDMWNSAGDLVIGRNTEAQSIFYKGWISEILFYDRALTPNEISQLHSEPYIMWELARRPTWKATGTTHNLTATAAAVTSTAGSLSVGTTEQMTATAAAVVSTTGSLTIGTMETMTATAAAVVTTAGTLTIGVTEPMTATAAAVVSTTGTLTIGVTESMTATAAAVVTTTGTLTIGVTESMTATAAAVVSMTGNLAVGETVSMTATAAVVTTATGRLTMLVTEPSVFIRSTAEKALGGYF